MTQRTNAVTHMDHPIQILPMSSRFAFVTPRDAVVIWTRYLVIRCPKQLVMKVIYIT
ncbi:hypothetical protein [Gordonia polyisoprenivorans]|uniref:hypothetical protein n=1 Tax=Gordonia polyisoprenivorans TaxID=84595 RepID=UPI001AD7D57D|nr:hypothetical protein [Gordonia polyisoprenivorans]QTI70667.1 hypothetical protein J6U32_09075 [Gordonia polyisoprenivorans]